MTVGEIIDAVRGSYLRRFAAAVAEQRTAAGRVLTEVVLRDEAGAPVGEGPLQLPMRLDIVPVSGGQPGPSISVNSESRVEFEHLEFLWGSGLRVHLAPFWWDSVRVSARIGDWKPLQRWFTKWFSADADGDGQPLGVVHFLSDPEAAPSGHAFTVDLGTAPVETFEGLLDAVEASGATSAAIGGDATAA